MKLRYKIISCSSQDPNFPVSNLLTNQHHWQSARFPTYPQQITLMFYEPAVIKSIKIISNHNKVPQKISLLYHLPTVNNESEFTKLGFVKFENSDKNEEILKSQGSLRQVKLIKNISLKAMYLRLIISKCIPQKDNFFNQVALSAIIIEGSGYDLHHIKLKNNSQVYLNHFIDNKINVLNQFKEKCIQNEQFNEANQIKLIIQHIRVLSNKISNLNQSKIEYIRSEDYDKASQIKLQIDKIKHEIEQISNNFYDPSKKTIKNYSFLNSHPLNKSTVAPNQFNNQFITIQNQKQDKEQKVQQNQDSEQFQDDEYYDNQLEHNKKVVPALLNKLKSSKVSQNSVQQVQNNQKEGIQPNLPAQPQEMSPSNQANSSCLNQFYQKVIIKKLHSKYWQFRLQAITFIENQCKTMSNSKIGKLKLRAYIFVYNKLIKEISKQIVGINMQLMNAITNLKLEDNSFKNQLFLELEKSVIQTLNTIQNAQNAKIKSQGQKVILRMIDSPVFGAQMVYNSIHRAYNDKLPPKIKVIYLQNLQYMINKYGITTNGIPFTICDFALKKSLDPNYVVRKVALNLLKSIKQKGGEERLRKCINQDENFKNSFLLKQLKI